MTSNILKGYVIKRRRRQALILSLVIHGFAIVLLALWLLKPAIQYIDNTTYAELINPLTEQVKIRKNVPKPKPISKVVREVTTSGVRGISSADRIPATVNPVVPVQDLATSDAPSIIENVTRLAPSPESILNQSQLDGPELPGSVGSGLSGDVTAGRGKSDSGIVGTADRGKGSAGLGNFSKGTGTGSGYADLGDGYGQLRTLRDEIGDKLGGVLKGSGAEMEGHIRIIRLKHALSDWWQDPTAIPSLIKWLESNTSIRADMSFAGGALPLTDPKILDAPLIIMTGHSQEMANTRNMMRDDTMQSGFSEAERAALRKYVLERGGTLFFDDCGFLKPAFSNIVESELRKIFPEHALEQLPHDHEIYKIYYNLNKPPEGGEVFWQSENKARPTNFEFHRGIYVPRTPGVRKQPNLTFKDSQGVLRTTNRLAVIFNRKDYLCAMETAEIESRTALRMRRSTDVYRFMTNLMIYTLKYGGNTDRSEYEK